MKIELAGINVPLRALEEALGELPPERAAFYRSRLNPIAIAAAFARVSRADKSVSDLLTESVDDLASAKISAQNIAFGMSHHSIADHVLFNFVIEGVSRLSIERIERRRIGVGYTEKSQRYVTLTGDFMRPEEFSSTRTRDFEALVARQNKFYFETFPKLFEYLKVKYSNEIEKRTGKDKELFLRTLEGWAKEDARYSLCLATEGQLGCSYAGQATELAVRDMAHDDLAEVRKIARGIQESTKEYEAILQCIDPEIFRRHNPGRELKEDDSLYTRKNLVDLVRTTFRENEGGLQENLAATKNLLLQNGDVTLVNSNSIDLNVIAAILHTYSLKSIKESCAVASLLIEQGKAVDFVKESLKYVSEFDKTPRAFEVCGGLIYEVVMSSSCFAQAKRQRMNTLTEQDYSPLLGYTFPPNIIAIGEDGKLREIYEASSQFYFNALPDCGKAAEYALTNGHRRRTLYAENLRQRYHVSRYREDSHAQWDIRDKEVRKSDLARQVAPLTTVLLAGKSEFDDIRKKVYEK